MSGLYPSHWPSDHGDIQRTQCSLKAGLPRGFDPDKISIKKNSELYYPVFMYMRDHDELFVYGRGTALGAPSYLAKVDPLSLVIKQRYELPFALYVGGAVVHENGNVYLIHGRSLYTFEGGDLDRVQELELPAMNGVLTCYNGMTVSSEGYLLVKGWSMDRRDAQVFSAPLKLGALLIATACAAIIPMRYFLPQLALLPALLAGVLLTTAQLKSWSGGFSWRKFLSMSDNGALFSMDPDTLEIVDKVVPSERMGFARITLTPTALEGGGELGGDLVLIPGDTQLHAWRCRGGSLTPAQGFGDTYRSADDGSYTGCGPTIMGDDVFFTDNVAPIELTKNSYRLYTKSMSGGGELRHAQLSRGAPGFNFWSNAVSPAHGLVVSWDTLGGWVEARDSSTLELVWESESRTSDCVVIGEDAGHVYTAHYDYDLTLQDYLTAFGPRPRVSNIPKSLRIFDLTTGDTIADIALGLTAPCMSMIIPGLNDDVFVGMRDGLLRVGSQASS